MANKRIFYAVQQVGLSPLGTTTWTSSHVLHGVQSIGMTTNFNLEQVFELGQIEIYENIENIPDVEVTIEKVLDGYPLVYHMATNGATSATLAGRSNVRTIVALSIFSDVQDSASGTPLSEVQVSGAYVSSLTYTFPVDGQFTESVTLVSNNKVWKTSSFTFTGFFNNTDQPLAISGSGGVNRREDILFGSGIVNGRSPSVLPLNVDGINASGHNVIDPTTGDYGAHLQTITVNCDLGREELFELGRRAPYHRFVNFPIEVTCEIEAISVRGDLVSATEEGVLGNGNNLTDYTIYISIREGTVLNLGSRNKLSNVSYGNGDAGGGNVTVTYAYSTFNTLTVTHPQDPTLALRV